MAILESKDLGQIMSSLLETSSTVASVWVMFQEE